MRRWISSVTTKPTRLLGFDALRGLCATGVAAYHVLFWSSHIELPVWGRYFVYVFFVLSGASIYIGYARKLASGYGLASFYIARYARIAPLFYAALLFQTIYQFLSRSGQSGLFPKALLNASLLFGFAAPGATSIVVGGWSLGIEFVFYLLFPLLVFLVEPRRLALAACVALILQVAFASVAVPGDDLTEAHWIVYSNPLGFSFYFIAGCYIGYRLQQPTSRHVSTVFQVAAAPLFVGIVLYGVLSVHGAHLTGIAGGVLPLCVVAVVYGWGLLVWTSLPAAHAANYLGNASYGMYLLHPMIYAALRRTIWTAQTPLWMIMTEVLVLSFAIAVAVDHFYERPMRHLLQGWAGKASSRRHHADS
jgi:peptidoglycan/LPS O-acetylase OafA/YrhL